MYVKNDSLIFGETCFWLKEPPEINFVCNLQILIHIHILNFFLLYLGESVSVIKHTDPIDDLKAVNQDKKNILFSVGI